MAIPSYAVGGGNNSTAQNVFRITFSQALSSVPTLESWDDSTFSSNSKEMFTGTAGNSNKPYLSAVATTDAAPVSAWKPGAAVGGGAVANRLLGTTSFVNLSLGVPGAGASVRFNLVWEVPFDASVPSTNTFNGVLACRFAFSGATPTLTWQFNDFSAGGLEGAPQWTTITPGSAGNFIRPTDSGVSAANLVITKPGTSTVDSAQQWVSNT